MKQEYVCDGKRYVWDDDKLIHPITPDLIERWHPDRRDWLLNGLRKDYWRNPNPRPDEDDDESPGAGARKSGPKKLTLRMPRDLYDLVTKDASSSGVSVNAYMVTVLALAAGKSSKRRP